MKPHTHALFSGAIVLVACNRGGNATAGTSSTASVSSTLDSTGDASAGPGSADATASDSTVGGDPSTADASGTADASDGDSSDDGTDATGTTDTGPAPIDLCTGLAVGDLADHPQSAASVPAVGASFVDPEFGSTIARISENAVPSYSTVSAWNADESLLLLYRPGSGHRLHDGIAYAFIESLPIAPEDLELVYWDTSDPDILYYPEGDALLAYSVSSGSTEPVAQFDFCAGSVSAGGDPFFSSFDSDLFGFKCGSTHFLYQRSSASILGMADSGMTLAPQAAPSGTRAYWQGLVVDTALQTQLALPLDSPFEHASMGWGPGGSDTYLSVVFDGPTVGTLIAYDMQSGATTTIIGPDTGYPYPPGGTHVSGLAYENPGWAIVSVVGDGDGASLLHGEIVVASWESGDVCRVAHHRSSGEDYFAEPHAVPSPTGTRVLFGSDWSGTTDAYVVELPAFSG